MVRCILCNKSPESHKKPAYSYFKFPTNDQKTLREWLKVCNLKPTQLRSAYRICSLHFKLTDMVENKTHGILTLKRGSVPTVLIPKKVQILENDDFNSTVLEEGPLNNIIIEELPEVNSPSLNVTNTSNPSKSIPLVINSSANQVLPISLINQSASTSKNSQIILIQTQTPQNTAIPASVLNNISLLLDNQTKTIPLKIVNNGESPVEIASGTSEIAAIEIEDDPVESMEMVEMDEIPLLPHSGSSSENMPEMCQREPDLPFSSNWGYDSLDTPERAKHSLDLAHKTITDLKKKVSTLKAANNRLEKRCNFLKNLVKHLNQIILKQSKTKK